MTFDLLCDELEILNRLHYMDPATTELKFDK